MASALPTPADCCDTCVCNVVTVDLCPASSGGGDIAVENTAALRLVLASQRFQNLMVSVLTDTGTPLDGTGYTAVWREESLAPDNPILSVRPADVLTDLDPGRFLQFI
jgi:hypothetical protein